MFETQIWNLKIEHQDYFDSMTLPTLNSELIPKQ